MADTIGGIARASSSPHLHRRRRARAPSARVELASGDRTPWPSIDPDKALAWVESKVALELARQPEARARNGAAEQGARHHRRTRCRQDDARQRASWRSCARRRLRTCVAPHRPVARRSAWRKPPASRPRRSTVCSKSDPRAGGFRRDQQNPLEVRPARRRRELDGRRADPARSLLRAMPDARRALPGRRRGPAALGRTRAGARAT